MSGARLPSRGDLVTWLWLLVPAELLALLVRWVEL